MRRLKPSSEHPRAVEASKSNEHEGNFEAKDLRGRAARSAGVPATAELNAGSSPGARGIPRRSKVFETRTTTCTTTMGSELHGLSEKSMKPDVKKSVSVDLSGLMKLVYEYQKSVDESQKSVEEKSVDLSGLIKLVDEYKSGLIKLVDESQKSVDESQKSVDESLIKLVDESQKSVDESQHTTLSHSHLRLVEEGLGWLGASTREEGRFSDFAGIALRVHTSTS